MKTIAIHAPSTAAPWQMTFQALSEAMGVSFEQRCFDEDANVDAWIVLDADRGCVADFKRVPRPCFIVVGEGELQACGDSPRIEFARTPHLEPVLRGREISADDAVATRALPAWLADADPIATKDGLPVWVAQQKNGCVHQYVSTAPPRLNEGEALFAHFGGQRLFGLLPLVVFLRSLNEEKGWEEPPLQAAFMFDDPNLHWTSYGFIEYHEMVAQAAAGNYHVSLATIPLDGWFAHRRASAIFKENQARISLLLHGNDHVSQELARYRSAPEMHRVLGQALGRIAKMEAVTGLDVARVMAPPHGACSEIALSEMARLGFEAVCVSRGSLRRHNPTAPWLRSIGFKPCEVVAGLPIIPRFGLSAACRNDILIAALLRQPIVPMTHHQAVAAGYDLLNETASFINSLGEIAWRDMTAIARSLYFRRRDGETLSLRMLATRVSVRVPTGITSLVIERSWWGSRSEEQIFWRPNTDAKWTLVPRDGAIPVTPGTTVEISLAPASARIASDAAGSVRLAPVARRMLTEARDRALPSIHRFAWRK
jgi:hypothetical protein